MRSRSASVVVLGSLLFASPVFATATITIVNLDGVGEGLNDPTPVEPSGGNSGVTIGQQRLRVLEQAASVLASALDSEIEIRIGVRFDPMTCSQTSAVLATASPTTTARDFANAPRPATWYPIALANKLAGLDIDPLDDDVTALFNSRFGTLGCPFAWYYGLNGIPVGGAVDLLSVALHELLHGLGFVSLVNLETGAKAAGLDDIYSVFLEQHSIAAVARFAAVGRLYPDMTNAERVAASVSSPLLHWTGLQGAKSSGCLTNGRDPTGHPQMYAPSRQIPGSSVSHWSTALAPNQMMEPSYTGANHRLGLAAQLLADLGWNNVLEPGDFSRDLQADIVWHNQATGQNLVWVMSGTTVVDQREVSTLSDTRWSLVATGDFNGDRFEDLLWRNTASGANAFWAMHGTVVTEGPALPSAPTHWVIGGSCDFDCDGDDDIIWRDTSPDGAGSNALWYLDGVNVTGTAALPSVADPSWHIVGTGDFNLDGRCDLLWRNDDNGTVATWHMANTALLSTAYLGRVDDLRWSPGGVGDYNRDGKPDILWFHPIERSTAVWLMNGTTIAAGVYMADMPAGEWLLAGPR